MMVTATNLTIRELSLMCSKDTEDREKKKGVLLLFSLIEMLKCSMNEPFIDEINRTASKGLVDLYKKNVGTEGYVELCQYLESKGFDVHGEFFREFTS